MSSVEEKIAAAQALVDAYEAEHKIPYRKKFFLAPVRDRNGDQSKVYIGAYTLDYDHEFPEVLGDFPVSVIDLMHPEGPVIDDVNSTRFRGNLCCYRCWETPEEEDELEKIEAAIDNNREVFRAYRNLSSFRAKSTYRGRDEFHPCVKMTVIDRTRIMGTDPVSFPQQIVAEDGTVYPVDIYQGIILS